MAITFAGSIDSLRPFGVLVCYGNASGPVDPISPLLLSQKGSLYLTRPSLVTHSVDRAHFLSVAADLLEVVGAGIVRVDINQTWPLSRAADAHRALEGRRTTGSSVLVP
mgnify:FL=1